MISNSYPEYSVLIATKGRSLFLANTLQDLRAQSVLPAKIVIVDASKEIQTLHRAEGVAHLPVSYSSSAKQRNEGASLVETELICFLDDDVRLPFNHFEKMLKSWKLNSNTIGISGKIEGLRHKRPQFPLSAYYKFQAGYSHRDYGGHVFGPAINCVPTYDTEAPLIEAHWLNSTCLLTRTDVFKIEKFPEFDGYSWGEDLHLTIRLRKHGPIFFENTSTYTHLSPSTPEKTDLFEMGNMQFTNMYRICRDCLNKPKQWSLKHLKYHLYFNCLVLARAKTSNWRQYYKGGQRALRQASE